MKRHLLSRLALAGGAAWLSIGVLPGLAAALDGSDPGTDTGTPPGPVTVTAPSLPTLPLYAADPPNYRLYLSDIKFPLLQDCEGTKRTNGPGGFTISGNCTPTADLYGTITVDVIKPDGTGYPGGKRVYLGGTHCVGNYIDNWEANTNQCPKLVQDEESRTDERTHFTPAPYRFQDAALEVTEASRSYQFIRFGKNVNWADLKINRGDRIRIHANLLDRDYSFGDSDDPVCDGTLSTSVVDAHAMRADTFTFSDPSSKCIVRTLGVPVS